MTSYDLWKTDNAIVLESDAEQAAAHINAHIAGSVDLVAMDCKAVADDDRVELYIGEFHCGAWLPHMALGHWRGFLINGFRDAITNGSPACGEQSRSSTPGGVGDGPKRA